MAGNAVILYFYKNEGMHFLDERLENYIEQHSEEEPALLGELNRITHLKVLQPRMITGHLQGRLLSMLSKIRQPRYILEIGTFTGYSALCLAEGLVEGGVLHTIDINDELHDLQRQFFDRSPYGHQIKQHSGDALKIIPKLPYTFDLIFIDAEKREYNKYLDLILPKTRPGSLILSDNVLWSGKVTDPLEPGDKATENLLEYNRRLKEDPRLETVMLPVRDGLTVSRVR